MSWRNSSPAVPPIARWVLVLFAGGTWLVVAWSVPRFGLTAIEQTAWLTGGLLLFAAFAELVHVSSTDTWRRTHAGLALMSLTAGGLCLLNIGGSVVDLTAVVGFFLLARGAVDVGLASVNRTAEPVWMVLVGLGIAEAIVGFWSAARFVTDVTGVVVTLAAFALLRAIADTITALRLRESRTGAHAADAHSYVAGHADYLAATTTMNTVTARHRADDTRSADTSHNADEGTQPDVFAMAPSGTATAGGSSRPGGPAPGRFGSDGSGGLGFSPGGTRPGPADVPPPEHTVPEEGPGPAPTPEPGTEATTSTGSTDPAAGPISDEGGYTGRRRARDLDGPGEGAGTGSPGRTLPENPLDGPSGMNVTRTPVHRAGPGEDRQAGGVGPLTNAPYWSGFGAAGEGLADRGRDVPVAGLPDEMIGRAQVAGMTGYPRFIEGLAEADGGEALPGRTGTAGTPKSFAERIPPVEHAGDSGSPGQIRAGMIIPMAPPSVRPEPIETGRSAYRTPAPEPTAGREAPAEEAAAREAWGRESDGGSSMAAWFGSHGHRRS